MQSKNVFFLMQKFSISQGKLKIRRNYYVQKINSSLALNKPVAFSYEGEMAAELAKEVQVYESQEV